MWATLSPCRLRQIDRFDRSSCSAGLLHLSRGTATDDKKQQQRQQYHHYHITINPIHGWVGSCWVESGGGGKAAVEESAIASDNCFAIWGQQKTSLPRPHNLPPTTVTTARSTPTSRPELLISAQTERFFGPTRNVCSVPNP